MKASLLLSAILLAVLLVSPLALGPQPSRADQQLPDLIVTEVWDSDNQICYTIKNIGQGAIGVIAPATFWNALFIDGDFKASNEVSISLAPGEQIDRCFSYQWQMTEPQHTIEVCADWGQNMIEESNEQNNCLEVIWTQNLPDLIVEKIECSSGNKLAVTINNSGSGLLPAGWSSLADVYFDYQYQGFFNLESPTSTTGGGINNPGGSSYYLLAWDITAPVTVMVTADYTDSINEANEQNNSKSETLDPLPAPTPLPTPIHTITPTPIPTPTPTPTPVTTPSPTLPSTPTPTPTPITIISPTPVFVTCWYSISGTIHDFWHDDATLKVESCEAETISLRPGPYGPVLPPITQCKEDGRVWYADVTRQFVGDLPGPDLDYNLWGLCPGEYIVAPVYNPGADLCEWQGSWRSAKGQVVRIEDSSATGFDFTFEPIDSSVPTVSDILASPEQPEIAEDVVLTILAEDDVEIAAIWEKTDTVFNDGSFHPGSWQSLTVTPGLEGSTAGAQFSITDDRIAEATVTAKVCDIGGNSHTAQKVITFGSCGDGIQNQGESGIDCGGPCPSECIDCLDDSALGSNPSAYLYSPEEMSFIQSTALGALSDYANEHSIMVTELDTSDEYIEAISWWVARHMGYRGDDQNRQCLNDILELDYEPEDYDHGDFPVPAYYTLNYSGLALASNPSKWYYGDCEDFAILESALLRSLGVSYMCIFNAEGPGHGYNVVNYQNKYRILEPQTTSRSSDIGIEERTGMYNLYNLWNDRVGAFVSSDFSKVWPWEYTMNCPGCEGLNVSASGGGFGEKTLWLDWEDPYAEERMPAVGDFDDDGLADIAFVWFKGSDAYGRFEAAVLPSTGSTFVLPGESLDRAREGVFTPITVAGIGRDYIVALYGDELECVGGTPRECSGCPGHVHKWYCSEVSPLVRIGDTNGNGYPNVVEFLKGDASEVTVNGTTWASDFSPGDEIPFVGDFDGDGLDDVISFENETWGGVRIARSVPDDDRFCAHELWHKDFAIDQEPLIGDFNGDGRQDIMSFDPDNGNVYVGLSTKFGFWSQGFDSQWLWKSDFCNSRDTLLVGDFDGDGRDDIACLSVDGDEVQIRVSLALPSSITYDCHGGSICDQAPHYIDAYWPSTCP